MTRRLLSATAVLAAGILLALPFRQETSSAGPGEGVSSPPITTNKVPLQIPSDLPDAQVPASPTEPTASAGALKFIHLQDGPPSEPEASARPPRMPHRVPAAEEALPPAHAIARPVIAPPPAVEAEPRERTHWIIDGDTLPKLAQRFLGDAARWPEIRDLNRDILPADDILPIGKELRIPPRERVSPPSVATPAVAPEPGRSSPPAADRSTPAANSAVPPAVPPAGPPAAPAPTPPAPPGSATSAPASPPAVPGLVPIEWKDGE